ncbi:phosphate acetyltransferase [Gleimia coleocanis]|nr:phosphate acetyltransferase [Gleimia coleocanis]
MTELLFLTASENISGGVETVRQALETLRANYGKVGVFRPFINAHPEQDPILTEFGGDWGTTRSHIVANETAAMNQVISKFTAFNHDFDAVLIVGLIDGDLINPGELTRAGRTAINLGATVALLVDSAVRTPERLADYCKLAVNELNSVHAPVSALIVLNPTEGARVAISKHLGDMRVITELNDYALIEATAEKTHVVTPLMFENALKDRARAQKRRIVLPESEDDRVLKAAAIILEADVADIILLGETGEVFARAEALGLDLSKATVVSVNDPAYRERYVAEFVRLREKKGVTVEQAEAKMSDVSYFGTMMVHLGDADGMVSGASHTTAETIVPSFQIIKTKPGTSIVSSVFLMLMEDRVLVFGDCAVNPNPTPEQLADIAISSAETAVAFGVDPRIALISYSTGASGSGPDVEAVIEATRIAREKRPDLALEGPIQFDASVDAAVAKAKLPDSEVAGRATVFVFPDLNTGNTTYKAVQRSAGAVAVGPVLQGLNKPVNDLSRGALVEDIVNTIAITAVQAQN